MPSQLLLRLWLAPATGRSDAARHMGGTVQVVWMKGGGVRLRALRAARPHTVVYVGVCDQQEGVRSPWIPRVSPAPS